MEKAGLVIGFQVKIMANLVMSEENSIQISVTSCKVSNYKHSRQEI